MRNGRSKWLSGLTLKGLEAACYELRRPAGEMGPTARGAGCSGASHPMAVNETVIAMLRPKPNMAKLAVDPPHVQAAVDRPDGISTIASYWTEVPLPATGKGGAQADIVLTAPQQRHAAAAHRGRQLPRECGGTRRQAGEVHPVL
ncbi:hypothetical protein [Streptomyces sp. IBSBF 2806]|uniref:hypothetical protein n=1 Tax=Streptomyces sp. IBSBF 2806 TaxID=2903529 RepID=UPI002FDC1181